MDSGTSNMNLHILLVECFSLVSMQRLCKYDWLSGYPYKSYVNMHMNAGMLIVYRIKLVVIQC